MKKKYEIIELKKNNCQKYLLEIAKQEEEQYGKKPEEEIGHAIPIDIFSQVVYEDIGWLFAAVDTEDKLLGYSLFACTKNSNTVSLIAFAVKDSEQGQGIGKSLVKHGLDVIKSYGFEEVIATVSPTNYPSLKVLTDCNFKIYDFKNDVYGKGEDRYFIKKTFEQKQNSKGNSR